MPHTLGVERGRPIKRQSYYLECDGSNEKNMAFTHFQVIYVLNQAVGLQDEDRCGALDGCDVKTLEFKLLAFKDTSKQF